MDLTALRASISGKIQDSAGTRWSAADKDAALNFVLRDFATYTKMVRQLVVLTAVSGSTCVYEQPSATRILEIHALWVVGSPPLTRATVGQLLVRSSTWTADTGTPYYAVFPYQPVAGVARTRIYPDPGVAQTTLTAYASVLTTDLVSGGDIPAPPVEYHESFADGAVARLLRTKGPTANASRADEFEATYLAKREQGKLAADSEFHEAGEAMPSPEYM